MSSTPEQLAEFVAGLEDLRDVTEDELRAAVLACPPHVLERLAQGPLEGRYKCGICEAFGRSWWLNRTPDRTDPMWIAWAYHEVPKLDMTHRRQLHHGPHSDHTYRRCIATYRAAGWTGEAEEPNA